LTIQLNRDVLYPANQSAATNGVWKAGYSSDENQYRLQGMKHDDVKTELFIHRVVFADNTIWNATP
jgi:hypothetical protein